MSLDLFRATSSLEKKIEHVIEVRCVPTSSYILQKHTNS